MKPNIISWAWSPLALPPVVIGANGMQTTTAITAAVGGVGEAGQARHPAELAANNRRRNMLNR